ncbi:TPA: hypothetical protein SMI27_004417 [Serratia liquefaciens]|nr:hypothetical protein [Serratia liquefaciens]
MTQILTTERLREIVEDGFLEHGDAKSMARELLANREAQPVLNIQFKDGWPVPNSPGLVVGSEKLPDGFYDFYTAPPAPAVPDEMTGDGVLAMHDCGYIEGWNACRAAMLAAAPEGGN